MKTTHLTTNPHTGTLTGTIRSFTNHIKSYWPLYGLGISICGLFWDISFLLLLEFNLYFILRNTMNLLQVVGPIYWIAKNNVPRTQPIIAKGFMHETASPWRKGTGIQIRVFSRSLQFGICKKQEYDETSGILSAVRGRFLDIPPREIGKMYKSSARKKHETLEQAK